METNQNPRERIIRGVVGGALLGVGLSAGRRAWWGVFLDLCGAMLVLSATTGFCHVYKTLGICTLEKED